MRQGQNLKMMMLIIYGCRRETFPFPAIFEIFDEQNENAKIVSEWMSLKQVNHINASSKILHYFCWWKMCVRRARKLPLGNGVRCCFLFIPKCDDKQFFFFVYISGDRVISFNSNIWLAWITWHFTLAFLILTSINIYATSELGISVFAFSSLEKFTIWPNWIFVVALKSTVPVSLTYCCLTCVSINKRPEHPMYPYVVFSISNWLIGIGLCLRTT